MQYSDIMIDLETLGTTPGSAILSVAAVPFVRDREYSEAEGRADAFYAKISLKDSLRRGFSVDADTLVWWLGQNKAAQDKAFIEGCSLTCDVALQGLSKFFQDHLDAKVWSNGADFDIPLLASYYAALGQPVPWKFKNVRCYRTIVREIWDPQFKPCTDDLVAHDPVDDCIKQIRTLRGDA